MNLFRRVVIIVAVIVILIGAGIAFLNARPASGPETTRGPLGNFDAETQSLIARAERTVFLIPF